MKTARLVSGDRMLARRLFAMMADVFEDDRGELSDGYLDRLLAREDFWAMAAFAGEGGGGAEGAEIVGGITAHTLPMTRSESNELFIYDLAVRQDHQRRGVGRRLMTDLRKAAPSSAWARSSFPPMMKTCTRSTFTGRWAVRRRRSRSSPSPQTTIDRVQATFDAIVATHPSWAAPAA